MNEGQTAKFELKVGPVGDPSMIVEWYFNGTMIQASKFVFMIFFVVMQFILFFFNLWISF